MSSAHELGLDPARLAQLDKHLAGYVDDGRLAGWQLAVVRHDEVAHLSSYGHRDREAALPMQSDTIVRIASMTKPITSVTAMSLWEEGVFELDEPVSTWLPSFADLRVYRSGDASSYETDPLLAPMTVRHLLSHTSGLTADFMNRHVVDELYRAAGFGLGGGPAGQDLASAVETLAGLPLLFHPGSAWGYSLATHVVGRLIEVWTGQPLDEAVRSRVTEPLAMPDTVWWADESRADRLAAVYTPHPVTGEATRMDLAGRRALSPPDLFNGGGGMLSTADDYVRFCRMLARGGELDGNRVLAPGTVALMTSNHLDGDLAAASTGGFAETTLDGIGFGLGFAVIEEPVRLGHGLGRGAYYWGGAVSTAFWVDPSQDLSVVFLAQLLPTTALPLRGRLRQLVNAAVVGP